MKTMVSILRDMEYDNYKISDETIAYYSKYSDVSIDNSEMYASDCVGGISSVGKLTIKKSKLDFKNLDEEICKNIPNSKQILFKHNF